MNKWEELKRLIDADLSYTVHYSSDKQFEHNSLRRVKEWMEQLETKESRSHIKDHTQIMAVKETPGFLYTDVPEFDRATWRKMLENLEGLS
jgi:hypothetical protein